MQALRKIIDVTGSSVTVELPPDWRLQKAEIIVLPLGNDEPQSDFQSLLGSLRQAHDGLDPGFSEDRVPQGDYEVRHFDD